MFNFICIIYLIINAHFFICLILLFNSFFMLDKKNLQLNTELFTPKFCEKNLFIIIL